MVHDDQSRDPLAWLEQMLSAAGSVRIGQKWQCPSHGADGEHTVSLRVSQSDTGKVLLHCHAGCDYGDVMKALKLPSTALTQALPIEPVRYVRLCLPNLKFPAPKASGTPSERGMLLEAEHPYGSPPVAWKVRYRHPTTGEKALEWKSVNANGETVPGLFGRKQAELPLYHERELRMAMAAGEPILLVESESSADALTKAGHYATTWPGGAGDPSARLAEVLGGYRNVVIVPDNDEAGLACLERLKGQLSTAKVLMPGQAEDARDLLARVGADEFRRLVSEQKAPSRSVERDEERHDAMTVEDAERVLAASEARNEHETSCTDLVDECDACSAERQLSLDEIEARVVELDAAKVVLAEQADIEEAAQQHPVTLDATHSQAGEERDAAADGTVAKNVDAGLAVLRPETDREVPRGLVSEGQSGAASAREQGVPGRTDARSAAIGTTEGVSVDAGQRRDGQELATLALASPVSANGTLVDPGRVQRDIARVQAEEAAARRSPAVREMLATDNGQALAEELTRVRAATDRATLSAAREIVATEVVQDGGAPFRPGDAQTADVPAQRAGSWDAVNAAHSAVTRLVQQRAADSYAEQARQAYQRERDDTVSRGPVLERGM